MIKFIKFCILIKKKGCKIMKKIFIILPVLFLFSMVSTYALCPIDGSTCTGGAAQIKDNLQNNFVNKSTNVLQTPNTLSPQKFQRYNLLETDTQENIPTYSPENLKPDIINNCQFGVCLP